jgi:hypothetical protein
MKSFSAKVLNCERPAALLSGVGRIRRNHSRWGNDARALSIIACGQRNHFSSHAADPIRPKAHAARV